MSAEPEPEPEPESVVRVLLAAERPEFYLSPKQCLLAHLKGVKGSHTLQQKRVIAGLRLLGLEFTVDANAWRTPADLDCLLGEDALERIAAVGDWVLQDCPKIETLDGTGRQKMKTRPMVR